MYPQPLLLASDVRNDAAQGVYLAALGRFAVRHEVDEAIKTIEINMKAKEAARPNV